MKIPRTLTITFLSDWHVGEGAGAYGHIDAIVRRSPKDGLPYLPAKTLTGILRDGCERIVFGLDAGNTAGPWHALLKQIFGNNSEDEDTTPESAALSIGPAHFEPDFSVMLCAKPALREALVFLKPGVQLDNEGVAQRQMLRFEEMVMAGATLTAEITLNLPKPLEPSALALLAAGSNVVERLGAKRRRGQGRCTLAISDCPINAELLDLLRGAPPEPMSDVVQSERPVLADRGVAPSGNWKVFALDLQLLAPIVVPAATLGNVVTTRDHIPGSLLLPALNRWLRQLLGELTTSALASGALQIRNAYPALGSQRLLPIPATIFKLKNGDTFTNHLARDPSDGQQRKQQRSGYVADNGLPTLWNPATSQYQSDIVLVETLTTTHATIEDQRQRPTGNVGGVFTYEAIRQSQAAFDRFTAELWMDTHLLSETEENKLEDWSRDVPSEVRIGRAKKDDYGRVSMACRTTQPGRADSIGGSIIVWLVSPLLIRNDALDPITDATEFAIVLSSILETECAGVALAPIQSFVRPWRDDGWNNAWQMQRATRFGLAPGSSFQFATNQAIPAEALARLQATGLGERRGEGYGEIRINPALLRGSDVPVLSTSVVGTQSRPDTQVEMRQLGVCDFTRALEDRAGWKAIRRRALLRDEMFRCSIRWNTTPPSNAQLGTLRSIMESLTDSKGLERLSSWLNALESHKTRIDKWTRDSRQMLRFHIKDVDGIWQTLDLADLTEFTLGAEEELRKRLRYKAIQTLWLVAISRQLQDKYLESEQLDTAEETYRGA